MGPLIEIKLHFLGKPVSRIILSLVIMDSHRMNPKFFNSPLLMAQLTVNVSFRCLLTFRCQLIEPGVFQRSALTLRLEVAYFGLMDGSVGLFFSAPPPRERSLKPHLSRFRLRVTMFAASDRVRETMPEAPARDISGFTSVSPKVVSIYLISSRPPASTPAAPNLTSDAQDVS